MTKTISILLPSRAAMPALTAILSSCRQPDGLPVVIEQGGNIHALNIISDFRRIHAAVKAAMPEAVVSELTRLSWGDV